MGLWLSTPDDVAFCAAEDLELDIGTYVVKLEVSRTPPAFISMMHEAYPSATRGPKGAWFLMSQEQQLRVIESMPRNRTGQPLGLKCSVVVLFPDDEDEFWANIDRYKLPRRKWGVSVKHRSIVWLRLASWH